MTTTRKRGAQPGNQNALKHGFYSSRFKKIELDDLDVVNAGVQDEIALLRISIRRLFEYVTDEAVDVETWIKYLSTISAALARLSALLKVQAASGEFDMLALISQAIGEINAENNTSNHV